MKSLRSCLIIASLTAFSASASAFSVGDTVLARYDGGIAWFSGVVENVQGDRVVVLYHDGDRETRPRDEVRPFDWTVGTELECNWPGGLIWTVGEIARIEGQRISFAYGDGETVDTVSGLCRSL